MMVHMFQRQFVVAERFTTGDDDEQTWDMADSHGQNLRWIRQFGIVIQLL